MHFLSKVRESKLTVSYTKYSKTIKKFRLSKILKKCLNDQMRNLTSFYMSYQQHASEHRRANGIVNSACLLYVWSDFSIFSETLKMYQLHHVPQEPVQKNKGFPSNARWGPMLLTSLHSGLVSGSNSLVKRAYLNTLLKNNK